MPITAGLSEDLVLPALKDLGLCLHMAFFWLTVFSIGYAGTAIAGLRKRLLKNPPKGLCPDCGHDLSDHGRADDEGPTTLECTECGALSYAVMKWLETAEEAPAPNEPIGAV